ncbi:MAG: serine/threonine-protein kinase [Myxococcota bacterium]
MSSSGQVEVELDLTGATLGPWRLEHVLGEGAMARVYQARAADGRVTAVKVLRREHSRDAELVSRFVREARAVNAIKHEHIVEVYDFGEQRAPDGTTASYQVMELLQGRLLSDVCDAGPLPLQQAVAICVQVAWALDAAHQIGVVHRDIKPENIYLHGPGAKVKVLDFGMAKLLKPIGELPKSGTMEGVVLGTPEYMAPEQALGRQVDLRADIYAVGLMLFELLMGARPFAGETFGKLLVEITSKPAPRLPERLPSGEVVPPALADVVMKCLAKSPEERVQTAEALARALEPYSGLPPAPPRKVQAPRPAPPPSADEEAALAAAVKGSPLPKVVAVLVGVAVLAAALVLFLK